MSTILRSLSRRLPLTVAAGLAGLVVQGYYAGHRTLPHFMDHDASGTFGAEGGVPVRIVALGDSALTGPGLLEPEDLWIRQMIDRLPPRYEIELHSLARGGAWARDVRREQLDEALALKPNIAILSAGSNDSVRGVSLGSIRRDLRHIAGSLAEVASLVIMTGVGDMGSIPRLPQPLSTALKYRSRATDRIHDEVASRHPRIVSLAMWEEGSGPFRERPELFGPDLFHPNRDGHAVWAELAYPVIAAACHRVAEAHR